MIQMSLVPKSAFNEVARFYARISTVARSGRHTE